MRSRRFNGVEIRLVYVDPLLNPPVSVRVRSEPSDNFVLAADRSAKCLTAGCKVSSCVLMLQHDLVVPVPKLSLAHNLPDVTRIADTTVAKA